MAKQFRLNQAAFRELRKAPKVRAEVERLANKVRDEAGEGYVARESPSRNRARFTVYPVTAEEIAENAKGNILVHILGGLR